MRMWTIKHEHVHGADPELQEVIDLALCRAGNIERGARMVSKEVRLMTVVIGLCALAIATAILARGNND